MSASVPPNLPEARIVRDRLRRRDAAPPQRKPLTSADRVFLAAVITAVAVALWMPLSNILGSSAIVAVVVVEPLTRSLSR